MQKTVVFVKPDGVQRGYAGKIIAHIEGLGLKLRALKMLHLTKAEAQVFYAVHRERHFFDSLTNYISSGPIVAALFEGEEAITKVRQAMGATDPAEAAPGTIRKLYAQNKERNAIHGSDSPESASTEIPFFFSALEITDYQREG